MLATLPAPALEQCKFPSENSDKSSEISDAMRLVRIAAEPRPIGDSVKAAIRRASRSLKWTDSRTRDVWYGNARRLDVAEMDALRSLAHQRDAATLHAMRGRHFEQLAALRARLAIRDADFHRDDIAALDWLLGQIR